MVIPLTPVRFKAHAASAYGNKLGIVCGSERFTYQEFNERCDRLSDALLRLGITPGDRVAWLSFNCHRLLEAYYAVPQVSAILLPINIRLSPDEVCWVLKDSSPRLLFFDPEFAPAVEGFTSCVDSIKRYVCLQGASPAWACAENYEELLQISDSRLLDCTLIDENSIAELFYTSGTTAHPKGVTLTHRNLYLHALYVAHALHLRDKDIGIYTVPLFHVNSWGSPHTFTLSGGRHVILRKFDPPAALKLIAEERVTRLQMVPSMAVALINCADFHNYDLSSVREVMIGGAPASTALIRQLDKKFPGAAVIGGYGLTETSPVVTIAYPKDHLKGTREEIDRRRRASAGNAIFGVEARVVDAAGNDVEADGCAVGELIVRSDTVAAGYWNQPEETARAFAGGWFHTGDLATIDEEGYILIVDRVKDMVLSGGENIATAEVERVIYDHPAVLECAVIAVPDEKWGEVPKAVVVLRSGSSAREEGILNHCRRHLAGYKVPKSVEFRDSLPKGGTGKILKRLLREPYWAGHKKRVH
ncbi:MAG: long-chain-fatty-acid--CoA ligase [Terriglobia bacterium]